MPATRKAPLPSSTAELGPRELEQLITRQQGADFCKIHQDTFETHFGDLAISVGPRLRRWRFGDVLDRVRSKKSA
jgi:hypothetical protein